MTPRSGLTIAEIHAAYKAGEFDVQTLVRSTLEDIRARDGAIGAFLETFDDEAIARATELDTDGDRTLPLFGIPVAIKDCILYRGHIASAGSKILAEYRAAYSSTAVERLLAAGAIIVGRTNMDEFAMGSSTENSAHQLTRNPWDTKKVPGGSSGGSIAAVAAGFVPLAFGTETGGSVRQPAALCGIVGVKPSYGRVSRYGVIALASSFDQIGPCGRTVEDAVLGLSIIEGKDSHDGTSVELKNPCQVPEDATLKGLKIGVPKEYFIDGIDPEVRARIDEAIALMKEQGATIVDISLPLSSVGLAAYYIIQPAEASSNLARFDGMRYGTRAPGSLEESYVHARGEGFGAEVKRRIILGGFTLSAGYADAFYKKALAVRAAIRKEFDEAFKNVDVIVSPTSPTVAWNLGERVDDPLAMYLADIFTVGANIAGISGVSVPCGFAHNLPVGLQFLAGAMEDEKALSAAAAYQKVTDWHTKRPA